MFKLKRLLNRIYKRVRRALRFGRRHEIFKGGSSARFYMSTVDLLNAQRKNFGASHFTMTDVFIRQLAIRNYMIGSEDPFGLYSRMQKARIGEDWSGRFEKLIKSFISSGFKYNVPIKVSRDLLIKDGSHRLALALEGGVDRVYVEMHDEVHNRNYGLDFFVRNNFSMKDLGIISRMQERSLSELSIIYTAILWPPARQYFEEITSLLSGPMYPDINIIAYEDISISGTDFASFVKMCYWGDDISKEKVEKKIDFIFQSSGNRNDYELRLLKYRVQDWRYKVKPISGQPQSLRQIEIKEDIRKRYRDRVPNYHHDIIIHASDNSLQSELIMDSLKFFNTSIEELFVDLKNFRYFAVKLDSPRQHPEFPRRFLVRSDVDLYVHEEQYEEFIATVDRRVVMLFPYKDLRFVRHYSSEGLRLRVECFGYLLLQFDIKKSNPDFSECLLQEIFALGDKELRMVNGVRCLPERFEVIFRLYDYAMHRSKHWHLTYLRTNFQIIERDRLLAAFATKRLRNRVRKILALEVVGL